MRVILHHFASTSGVYRRLWSSAQNEIKTAYHKLAKTHHPDVTGNDPAAAEKFKQVNHAYSVLSDTSARRAYDMTHPFAGGGFHNSGPKTSYKGGNVAAEASTGFGYRKVSVDEAFDFEEWSRMHFGPTSEEARRASEESIRRAKETGFVGATAGRAGRYSNASGDARGTGWEARRAAKERVKAWEGSATEVDTATYRRFAEEYRKAASTRISPARTLSYIALAAGIYTVAHLIAKDNAR